MKETREIPASPEKKLEEILRENFSKLGVKEYHVAIFMNTGYVIFKDISLSNLTFVGELCRYSFTKGLSSMLETKNEGKNYVSDVDK